MTNGTHTSTAARSLIGRSTVYSLPGLVVFILLFISSTAYIRAVPRLKKFFLSEKKGVWGALYKASVVGTRLHWLVSLACIASAVYLLLGF